MKDLYAGVFNLNRQVFIEYAYAASEKQAWLVFCRRIAKKTGVFPNVTMNYFNGEKDNYKIRKEIEFEEI
jgi:hypothetical protein